MGADSGIGGGYGASVFAHSFATAPDRPAYVPRSAAPPHAALASTLGTLLDRSATPGDLAALRALAEQGKSLTDIRIPLAHSPEAAGKINTLFQQVFGRSADAGSLSTYEDHLGSD